MVVGSSQTRQWFVHEGLFESLVGDDRWQLLWLPEAVLEKWADPDYSGWGRAPESPCLFGSANPDRVVLTIGGAARSDTRWIADIRAAVDAARERFPKAAVVLQPLVGAPSASCESFGRPVVAAENHRAISAAVKAVQGNGVEAGAVPRLTACSGYRDPLGHLEAAGLPGLARLLAAHYAATGP